MAAVRPLALVVVLAAYAPVVMSKGCGGVPPGEQKMYEEQLKEQANAVERACKDVAAAALIDVSKFTFSGWKKVKDSPSDDLGRVYRAGICSCKGGAGGCMLCEVPAGKEKTHTAAWSDGKCMIFESKSIEGNCSDMKCADGTITVDGTCEYDCGCPNDKISKVPDKVKVTGPVEVESPNICKYEAVCKTNDDFPISKFDAARGVRQCCAKATIKTTSATIPPQCPPGFQLVPPKSLEDLPECKKRIEVLEVPVPTAVMCRPWVDEYATAIDQQFELWVSDAIRPGVEVVRTTSIGEVRKVMKGVTRNGEKLDHANDKWQHCIQTCANIFGRLAQEAGLTASEMATPGWPEFKPFKQLCSSGKHAPCANWKGMCDKVYHSCENGATIATCQSPVGIVFPSMNSADNPFALSCREAYCPNVNKGGRSSGGEDLTLKSCMTDCDADPKHGGGGVTHSGIKGDHGDNDKFRIGG